MCSVLTVKNKDGIERNDVWKWHFQLHYKDQTSKSKNSSREGGGQILVEQGGVRVAGTQPLTLPIEVKSDTHNWWSLYRKETFEDC